MVASWLEVRNPKVGASMGNRNGLPSGPWGERAGGSGMAGWGRVFTTFEPALNPPASTVFLAPLRAVDLAPGQRGAESLGDCAVRALADVVPVRHGHGADSGGGEHR